MLMRCAHLSGIYQDLFTVRLHPFQPAGLIRWCLPHMSTVHRTCKEKRAAKLQTRQDRTAAVSPPIPPLPRGSVPRQFTILGATQQPDKA